MKSIRHIFSLAIITAAITLLALFSVKQSYAQLPETYNTGNYAFFIVWGQTEPFELPGSNGTYVTGKNTEFRSGDTIVGYIADAAGNYIVGKQAWLPGADTTALNVRLNMQETGDPSMPVSIRSGAFFGEELLMGVYRNGILYRFFPTEILTVQAGPNGKKQLAHTDPPMMAGKNAVYYILDGVLGNIPVENIQPVPYYTVYFSRCPVWPSDQSFNIEPPNVGQAFPLSALYPQYSESEKLTIATGDGQIIDLPYAKALYKPTKNDIERGYVEITLAAEPRKLCTGGILQKTFTIKWESAGVQPVFENLDFRALYLYTRQNLELFRQENEIIVKTTGKYPAVQLQVSYTTKNNFRRSTDVFDKYPNGQIDTRIKLRNNWQDYQRVYLVIKSMFYDVKYWVNVSGIKPYRPEPPAPQPGIEMAENVDLPANILAYDPYTAVGIDGGKLAVSNKTKHNISVEITYGGNRKSATGVKSGSMSIVRVKYLSRYKGTEFKITYKLNQKKHSYSFEL